MKQKQSKTELLNFAQGKNLNREPKVFRVIERDGIKTCNDKEWPDQVTPDDIIINVKIIKSNHE